MQGPTKERKLVRERDSPSGEFNESIGEGAERSLSKDLMFVWGCMPNQGWTGLISTRSFESARPLLEHGADAATAAAAEEIHEWTPLHKALSVEVALLLEHGANATARDESMRTPLHEASTVDIASLLLRVRHGADVAAEDEDKQTPLHGASGLFL